jgi:hypothetical protein
MNYHAEKEKKIKKVNIFMKKVVDKTCYKRYNITQIVDKTDVILRHIRLYYIKTS